jgi:hypothetical protein
MAHWLCVKHAPDGNLGTAYIILARSGGEPNGFGYFRLDSVGAGSDGDRAKGMCPTAATSLRITAISCGLGYYYYQKMSGKTTII